MCISQIALNGNSFYVAAVVKPHFAYFFSLHSLGAVFPRPGRLAALVDTQLRLTHVLPPMQGQTRALPLDLFPRLR